MKICKEDDNPRTEEIEKYMKMSTEELEKSLEELERPIRERLQKRKEKQ